MRNFWLIAKHEYGKRINKRSFLISTLGLPLVIILIIGVTILTTVRSAGSKPLGYIDQSGRIEPGEMGDWEVDIQPYADEESAQAALAEGEIQAYYVIPADYLTSRQVSLYYWDEAPGAPVMSDFDTFLRTRLTPELAPDLEKRILNGSQTVVRSLDGSREISMANFVSFLLPYLASTLLIFTVMGSAGYLLQVVADEKESRTIEVLITTLSPEELIGGKAVGLMGVALTQIGVWLLAIAAGIAVGARFVEVLGGFQVPWGFLLLIAAFFIPAFALIAGFMTAVGGSVTEVRQGQQIGGLLNMLFILPVFFSGLVFANPDSPILVFMTFFPTTSFITVMMRWAFGGLPVWQVAASWALLVAAAGLSVWGSARIFRRGMLAYGSALSLRSALEALRLRS